MSGLKFILSNVTLFLPDNLSGFKKLYSRLTCVLVYQKQPLQVFYKKDVLKKFTKFIEKHLSQSFFFNKVEC